MMKNNELIEFPNINDNLFGISKKEVNRIGSERKVKLFLRNYRIDPCC